MRRIVGAILALALVMAQLPVVYGVSTSASGAILMDADSGRVLYEQNAHQPRLIASVTKLMTALVALESGHPLEAMVSVAPEWAGVEGSSIYLMPGEQITLEALLYGLLLCSGNDAALAIAGFCEGTVADFVAQMNQKAIQLGMKNSHFANPNGLNAPGHYSSAYDMALLAQACLENEALSTITATKSITLGNRTFTNHNKLLWQYQGCIGLKTGYTEKAGRTLVSAAERDGMRLICVTLNDSNDWADHRRLFDYGFATYSSTPLTQKGVQVCRVPVLGGLMPFAPVIAGETTSLCIAPKERLTQKLVLNQSRLHTPILQGTQVGEVIYYLNGREAKRVPLVLGASMDTALAQEKSWLTRLKERFSEG